MNQKFELTMNKKARCRLWLSRDVRRVIQYSAIPHPETNLSTSSIKRNPIYIYQSHKDLPLMIMMPGVSTGKHRINLGVLNLRSIQSVKRGLRAISDSPLTLKGM